MEKESLRRDHWKSNHRGIWGASAGKLETSWRLETSERSLESILEASWTDLGVSWGLLEASPWQKTTVLLSTFLSVGQDTW